MPTTTQPPRNPAHIRPHIISPRESQRLYPRHWTTNGQGEWVTYNPTDYESGTKNPTSSTGGGPSSAVPEPTKSTNPSGSNNGGGDSNSSNPSATSVIAPSSTLPPLSDGFTYTSFTSTFPTTISGSPTFAESLVVTPTFTGSIPSSTTPQTALNPICIGDGLDTQSWGMLMTLLIPSLLGLLLWLIFAVLRPRFRQIYALREWFVPQDLRPQPLRSTFWAFLFPHVPLVPKVPADVSDAGKSAEGDAELFPSDEQLSQRALWVSFLIVLGWSVIAIAGALPLYLVETPCLAEAPPALFSGAYSALQDLSIMRLFRLIKNDEIEVNTNTLNARMLKRAVAITGDNAQRNIRIRIIVLTVLVILLGLLPALWKIMKELRLLIAYRKRFIEVKCDNIEMGWLSAKDAPGFVGWGEKRLKDFILKSGLSSEMGAALGRNGTRNGLQARRPKEEVPLSHGEESNLDVNIQSLFSIGDTHALALLIDERDAILEQLEIAETRYISSFRLSTPDPSVMTFEPRLILSNSGRPEISRPRALGGTRRRNPAFAASSLAPTSFVAPSSYYKLRGVQGVSGGRFADHDTVQETKEPSLAESINSRVVGTRFQEVNRNSNSILPTGSHLRVGSSGELGPITGRPNQYFVDEHGVQRLSPDGDHTEDDDWEDLANEAPLNFNDGLLNAGDQQPRRSRRGRQQDTMSTEFPLRDTEETGGRGDSQLPPHMRLQPHQPFVRPISGLDHSDLGDVYGDISAWRTKLKVINAEIAESQRISYNEIADGTNIKGWLMIGRGLRFLPKIQLIEGRAKEDIRWDVLQNERSFLDSLVLWAVVAIACVLLAAGLTAATGLALSSAPNFTKFVPFLSPVSENNGIWEGIVTTLVPAVAATFFIVFCLAFINWAANIRGSISVSGGQLLIFKITFYILLIIAGAGLITVGAVLFAMNAFDTKVGESSSVADGSVYMAAFAMVLVINVAVIFPALLMLQPARLWRVIRAQRSAITPRQRFRATYPRTYSPSYATAACILAIVFASTFSIIFPLLGPAVTVLLLLTLIAHRFLIGYVYARTHSQTGGLLQIWLMRRFGDIVALQPLLLGLLLLTREFWVEGGVLVGTALGVVIFVETYATLKTRLPGRKSLSAITRDSLNTFTRTAKDTKQSADRESSLLSSGRNTRNMRGSMASVLEMMSLTLAVMPSPTPSRGPIPLQTETLDDLTATERAARTHHDAPPFLPPLAFGDHATEMGSILYAPELLAPPPMIWLPLDSAGVARSEAFDLQRYHRLEVTLDVRAKEDVSRSRTRSSASRRRSKDNRPV